MNIKNILNILPHRYPILLVDRIVSKTENTIETFKNITINEEIFNGHFPNNPIYPGIYQIEGMAQSAALLVSDTIENFNKKTIFFLGIDKCKFRKPVVPGDKLVYKIELIKKRRNICSFKGKCYVDDILVSEAELKATIVD
jgi:3-hydroxyacyl-[acyl-carrier-protein] dehydratase